MKKKLMILLICIFLLPVMHVKADNNAEFILPVDISWGNDGLVLSETYTLTIKPDNAAEPMPTQSQYTISSGTKMDFVSIKYDQTGEYWYAIDITRSDGKNIGTWYVHVTVVRDGNGNLSATGSLHDDTKTGDKSASIKPHDSNGETPHETSTPEPSPTSTPVPSPSSTPSITPVPTPQAAETPGGTVPKTNDTTQVSKYFFVFIGSLVALLVIGKIKHNQH